MRYWLIVAALLGTMVQAQAVYPTLPQAFVNLALPTQGVSTCPTYLTGSNCIRNVPSGNATDFQNAINASTCGDTIVLVAGSTYSGNFTIPSTSCSGWIEIVSSALSSLPSPGNRVGPSNVSNMATISTPNASPAIQFLPSTNHWRLMGLEITTSYVSTSNTVYFIVSAGLLADLYTPISVQSQLPAYLIFDRIYIHGLSTTNTQHGLEMDAQSIALVDSYCDEIHHNGADSQCFGSWNGTGPYLIQNNFIQAAGENIIFGGADPVINNLVPSDITIVGNLIQKNTAWKGEAAPYNWVVKNLFELKNAQRVLLDGNVIQYTWAAAQAEALIIRSVNQSGACTWCVVQDVTVSHNLIQHGPMGVVLAPIEGPESTNPAVATARVLVQNNVFTDINSVTWGGYGWVYEVSTSTAPTIMHDITLDHNTSFANAAFLAAGDVGTINNIQITNSISDYGTYGLYGAGTGPGTDTTSIFFTNLLYNDVVFIDASGTRLATYPSGTFWSTRPGVDFTSVTGIDPDLSGNFQLTSSSPYYRAGTDGKDIGAWDWTCLNNDSAAALAGKSVSSQGCALSGTLLPQPTNLNARVQ